MVKNKQGLRAAMQFFYVQLIVVGVLASMVGLTVGLLAGRSVVLGCLVSIIPNVYFAISLFRYHGAQAASKIVKNFYKGEAVKLVLTVVLFALVFSKVHVNPLMFFMGFIAAQLMHWFAPLFFDNKRR